MQKEAKDAIRRFEPEVPPNAKSKARGNSSRGNALMGVAVTGISSLMTLFSQLSSRDYFGAAETTATTALSFTPAAPATFAYAVSKTYHSSAEIQSASYKDGQWWENATGSKVIGATARALSAVGRSSWNVLEQMKVPLTYETQVGGKRFNHYFDGTITDASGKVIYMRRW